MTLQDILENNLSIIEAHTNDFHQKLSTDTCDESNEQDSFITADSGDVDFFEDDCDPAGGFGLSSHI